MQSELDHDVASMHLDSVFRDVEDAGHFFGAVAFGNQAKYLSFTLPELGWLFLLCLAMVVVVQG